MIELGLSHLPRRPVEVRERSYTDTVIARLVAASAGAGDGGALAAIETAARWWGLGLASATVKPEKNLALDALTPSALDTIGRALCRFGESLHVIAVRGGRVTLTPTASWTVHGSDDPASWLYRVTLSGPDSTRTITLPAASVLHVRYAPHPSRPWAGRSPCDAGRWTPRELRACSKPRQPGNSNSRKRKCLTPRRSAGDYAPTDSLTPDTISRKS